MRLVAEKWKWIEKMNLNVNALNYYFGSQFTPRMLNLHSEKRYTRQKKKRPAAASNIHIGEYIWGW